MREFVRADARLGRASLPEVWEEARPLLEKALEGSSDTIDMVLDSCFQGTSCFLASDQAFVVTGRLHEPDGDTLIVWAAASRKPDAKLVDFEAAVDEIADLVGAKRVQFWTTRAGFSKLLSAEWRVKFMCWEKEVKV